MAKSEAEGGEGEEELSLVDIRNILGNLINDQRNPMDQLLLNEEKEREK